jgi:hypothetical protein
LAAAFGLGIGVALVGCGSGSPSPTPSATTADALAGVHWQDHVRDCSVAEGGSGLGTLIDDVVTGDVTGDGRVDTLVVDRCNSSTSSWPQEIEVFDGASDPAHPTRLAILLKDDKDYPRDLSVTVEPGGRVVVVGKGLSYTAPLCCPDIDIRRVFSWSGGSFTLAESTTSPAAPPS